MTEVAALLFEHGLPLVFLVAFLSCLAVPVPASLVFMAAGTVAASGELALPGLWLSGLAGAVLGDQAGYFAARQFGSRLVGALSSDGKIASGIAKARLFEEKWGEQAIFFSRWLASPLGPWINLSSGLTRFSWYRFSLWQIAGEVVWVSLYLGLGYFLSDQATAIADMIGNAIWLIAAAAITWLLFARLRKAMARQEKAA